VIGLNTIANTVCQVNEQAFVLNKIRVRNKLILIGFISGHDVVPEHLKDFPPSPCPKRTAVLLADTRFRAIFLAG
ncbi:MAG: hypothetical protein WBW79_16110, partial [Desulfocapsaceae bacterium]